MPMFRDNRPPVLVRINWLRPIPPTGCWCTA